MVHNAITSYVHTCTWPLWVMHTHYLSACPLTQVESDIAPYKGLLMGLFFMSVGMEISGQLFLAKWQQVLTAIAVLIVGKTAVMTAVGPVFGLSRIAATRAGLLLAPGGEFAFVAFGEAVANNILPRALSNELVGLVMVCMC